MAGSLFFAAISTTDLANASNFGAALPLKRERAGLDPAFATGVLVFCFDRFAFLAIVVPIQLMVGIAHPTSLLTRRDICGAVRKRNAQLLDTVAG